MDPESDCRSSLCPIFLHCVTFPEILSDRSRFGKLSSYDVVPASISGADLISILPVSMEVEVLYCVRMVFVYMGVDEDRSARFEEGGNEDRSARFEEGGFEGEMLFVQDNGLGEGFP